jgi:hypothetical protein
MKHFRENIDASQLAVCGTLSQMDEGELEHLVSFYSRSYPQPRRIILRMSESFWLWFHFYKDSGAIWKELNLKYLRALRHKVEFNLKGGAMVWDIGKLRSFCYNSKTRENTHVRRFPFASTACDTFFGSEFRSVEFKRDTLFFPLQNSQALKFSSMTQMISFLDMLSSVYAMNGQRMNRANVNWNECSRYLPQIGWMLVLSGKNLSSAKIDCEHSSSRLWKRALRGETLSSHPGQGDETVRQFIAEHSLGRR